MGILLKPSRGVSLILRPQSRARWYPEPTAPAATVDVWMRSADRPTHEAQFLGNFLVGQTVPLPFTPDVDRNLVFHLNSRSTDGTPYASSLEDMVQATLLFKRVTTAPVVTQVGAATADVITIAADDTESRFVRARKVRTADNEDMTDASVIERDYGSEQAPRLIEVSRTTGIVAAFTWDGDDPAANGFTKTGSGTTAASSSPPGWKITTSASDAATYHTKNSFPADAFDEGLTLEVEPPTVNASDGAALPNDSAMVRVSDGTKRYDLRFDAAGNVYLNGGAARALAGAKVRLVVAAGGLVADLWVGDAKVENDTAGAATGAAGLSFGDLAGADDSEVIWERIEYALTPQDVLLAQTIFVAVSHSGGNGYGAESEPLEVSFASEGGSGGSTGSGDLVPRDRFDIPPEL